MTRYAIDAPTLLAIAAGDVDVDTAHQLVAPARIRSDALAILLDAVRSGSLPEAEALTRHERLTEMKLRALTDRVSRRVAWDLASAHDWELGAAEYVAVAKLQADALVTADDDLAGQSAGIVPVAARTALAGLGS